MQPIRSMWITFVSWLFQKLPIIFFVASLATFLLALYRAAPIIPTLSLFSVAVLISVFGSRIKSVWGRLQEGWDNPAPQELPQAFGQRRKKINRVFVIPRWSAAVIGIIALFLFLQGMLFYSLVGMMVGVFALVLCTLALFDSHLNLSGLHMDSAWTEDGVKGRPQALRVGFSDKASRHRQGLQAMATQNGFPSPPVFFEISPQASVQIQLQWTPTRRGLHEWPLCRVHTCLPFGFFHAWVQIRPSGLIYVAPLPEESPPPPPLYPNEKIIGVSSPRPGMGDEWRDLRPYRAGDSSSRIAWKESARFNVPLSRIYEQEQAEERLLRWDATLGLDYEMRLSRLAAWVFMAHQSGEVYTLDVPGSSLGPGHGASHLKNCMRLLASQPLAPRS
jgi:uncharacterized protein (DUF58 family)